MSDKIKKAIIATVKKYPAVKLAYLFGSRAGNSAGPMSDYDIAVYTDRLDKKGRNALRLALIAGLAKTFGTDAVDVVVLNDARSPELKYAIIKDGQLVYDREPYRVIVEPAILNEYFDFRQSLLRYGLTKA